MAVESFGDTDVHHGRFTCQIAVALFGPRTASWWAGMAAGLGHDSGGLASRWDPLSDAPSAGCRLVGGIGRAEQPGQPLLLVDQRLYHATVLLDVWFLCL